MHGDSLCTDDTEYMIFRAKVRSPAFQMDFLGKSVAERDQIIRGYREISKSSTAAKKPEIMDVNQQAVESVMREHHVQRLIHGHTHRPKEHLFNLDGRPARRMCSVTGMSRVACCGWTARVGTGVPATSARERRKIQATPLARRLVVPLLYLGIRNSLLSSQRNGCTDRYRSIRAFTHTKKSSQLRGLFCCVYDKNLSCLAASHTSQAQQATAE